MLVAEPPPHRGPGGQIWMAAVARDPAEKCSIAEACNALGAIPGIAVAEMAEAAEAHAGGRYWAWRQSHRLASEQLAPLSGEQRAAWALPRRWAPGDLEVRTETGLLALLNVGRNSGGKPTTLRWNGGAMAAAAWGIAADAHRLVLRAFRADGPVGRAMLTLMATPGGRPVAAVHSVFGMREDPAWDAICAALTGAALETAAAAGLPVALHGPVVPGGSSRAPLRMPPSMGPVQEWPGSSPSATVGAPGESRDYGVGVPWRPGGGDWQMARWDCPEAADWPAERAAGDAAHPAAPDLAAARG